MNRRQDSQISPPVGAVDSAAALLTNEAAAALLGLSAKTLELWRCLGRPSPRYVKLGRSVRYRRADIEEFIRARLVQGEANHRGGNHAR